MANDKFDRVKKILEVANYPSTADIAAFFKKLIESVNETRKALNDKIDERLASLRDGIDGKNGKDGKDGRDGKDGAEGPVGPMGSQGPQGEALAGPAGKDGTDGSPDFAEDIRNKLELLTDDERLDKKAIKGIDEIEKQITRIGSRAVPRVSGRTDFWQTGDLKSTHTISVQTTAPGNPQIGDLWVDTT